ncbi:hypothetical protein L7F22_031908 [Adiantum nelumboides]|nr:hypothetical protein [Adiantum nelumboides]
MICHLLHKKGDVEKGELLLLCLRGNAEQWYWNMSSQIGESYTRISKTLKATFFKAPTMEQLWASIQMLHQIGDDYYAYEEEFSHRWTRCEITSSLPDCVKVQQFIDDLSPFLKPKVASYGPSTFEEAISIARRKFCKYFYIQNGVNHDVQKPYQQEQFVTKESYPLQWFSSSILTNDEDNILNRRNDHLATYDSSVEMCDEVSMGSFSSTSTTTSQHLEENVANDIEYGSVADKKSNPFEEEMPVKVEQYLVQCDAMLDQDLQGNTDPMKNLESPSSLEKESEKEEEIIDGVLIEEEEKIIGGGIIEFLDRIERTKETDCLLQGKVEVCEVETCEDNFQEMCVDVIKLWDGPCKVGRGLVLVSLEGEVVAREQVILEESASNNGAEYDALINGLKVCLAQGIQHLMVKGDALLIVEQILGVWACKNERLRSKVIVIRKLCGQFQEVQLYHIPRKENEDTYLLAHEAITGQDEVQVIIAAARIQESQYTGMESIASIGNDILEGESEFSSIYKAKRATRRHANFEEAIQNYPQLSFQCEPYDGT